MRVWVLLAVFLFLVTSLPCQVPQPRLAVLPFKSAGNATFADVSERIADMLMTNLSESQAIRVVERAQVDRAVKNFRIEQSALFDAETAQKIGSWLGATHVVLGSIVSIENQVRIDARVVNVRTGELEKSAKVEGQGKGLFALIDDLSARILSVFTGELKDFREPPMLVVDRVFTVDVPSTLDPAPQILYRVTDPLLDFCLTTFKQYVTSTRRIYMQGLSLGFSRPDINAGRCLLGVGPAVVITADGAQRAWDEVYPYPWTVAGTPEVRYRYLVEVLDAPVVRDPMGLPGFSYVKLRVRIERK
jgi:TolB-like protein